jgi:hypothetical protein
MCPSEQHESTSTARRADARRPGPDAGCPAARHGTPAAYSYWGCRCQTAREAKRIYHKRLREHRAEPGRVDASGTIRRVRALAALGWPQPELARMLGCHPRALGQLGRRSRMVHAATAENVAALYEELSMRPGPSVRARNRAARLGYVPPLGWAEGSIDDPDARPVAACDRDTAGHVDPVVVARLRNGQPPARVTRCRFRGYVGSSGVSLAVLWQPRFVCLELG